MDKREYRIGDTLRCGFVTLRCEKADGDNACEGCFFCRMCDSECDETVGEIAGDCFGIRRKDRTDVIFKQVEEAE